MAAPHSAVDPLIRNPIGGVAAGTSSHEEPLPLLEYLQLLWYRKWTILAITLLVGIAAWVWVNQQTPIFRAQSTIMLGMPAVGMSSPEMMWMAYYNQLKAPDELEVLKSRSLAEKMVRDLNLLSYPEFNPSLRQQEEPGLFDAIRPAEWIPDSWKQTLQTALNRRPQDVGQNRAIEQDMEQRQIDRAVGILQSGLELTNLEMSNVIEVSFRSTNPKIAAMVANELPEVYILSTLEAKYEATEKATKWLSEQLADLRQEVEDAERAVEIYRSEHGLTEVDGQVLLTEQLSQLNSELIIARAERAEAEVRLNQARQLGLDSDAAADAAVRLLDSGLLSQLRTQELAIQQNISELAVEYGPKHPRMMQAMAELDQVRERIQTEIDKVEISLQNEVDFARARERSLEASLREAETATGEQNREAIQLRALQREADASRALFETFLEQFKTTSKAEGLNEPGARVLSKAQIPGSPSYPNVRRQTTVITLGGFVVALLIVLGLEVLNPGITNPEQAEKALRAHTLGIVPLTSDKASEDLPLEKPKSNYVEALNTLTVSLSLTDPDSEPRTMQVTSSVPEEGKTTLAISLARIYSGRGERVILVDCDLRRGAIEGRMGLPAKRKGLTDFVLEHDGDLDQYLLQDPKSDLRILPPGSAVFANATDIFASQRMSHIVDVLRRHADRVLFDTPPVMAVPDARLVGRLVDKTVFAVRWNKTPVKVARAALKILRDGGTDIAGIVLQQVDLKRYGQLGYGDSGYYYHYGRYGQYYRS